MNKKRSLDFIINIILFSVVVSVIASVYGFVFVWLFGSEYSIKNYSFIGDLTHWFLLSAIGYPVVRLFK